MGGTNVQYESAFTGGVLLFASAAFPQERQIRYADSNADAGPALVMGGGFDSRVSTSLSVRIAMDYDPRFWYLR